MILFALSAVYDILNMYNLDETIVYVLVIQSIVFGAGQIIFGISLLGMKNQLGTLIQVNGIVEIIVGVCLASVVLATAGLFLLIPAVIIEIIVLYKLANK